MQQQLKYLEDTRLLLELEYTKIKSNTFVLVYLFAFFLRVIIILFVKFYHFLHR